MRNNLCRHYEWISSTSERMINLNDSLFESHANELVDKTRQSLRLSQQTTVLDKDDMNTTNRIKDCIKSESQTLCDSLMKFLKTDSGHQTLIFWETDDCPKADGNWKSVAKNGWDEIKCRMSIYINKWASSTKAVEKIERKILRIIESYFDLNEEESLEIEKQLKADDKSSFSASLAASQGLKSSISHIFKSQGKDSVKRKMYSRGLGGAIVKDISFESADKTVKYLFKPYTTSICSEVMTEATKLFLNTILETRVLNQAIKSYLEPLENKLQNVTKTIKEICETNKKMLQTLNTEIGKLESNTTVQKNIHTNCVSFQSHLDLFFARYLLHEHFDFTDLKIDRNHLSRGDTFDIFPGEINSDIVTREVVVKMSRKVISEDNATALMARDKQLRTLSHANLVKYYGTVIWRQKKGKRIENKLLLLLELFPQSLIQHCSSGNHTYPSKADDGSRDRETLKTAEFVSQICKGLAYIHSRNLVYGCLRTSSVFITSSGVVKLKDVCFMASGKIIQNQDYTSVYTAPELLEPGVVVATSSDIYSLAIVVWELWYGIDPVEHISSQLFTSLRKSVKRGLRPSLSYIEMPPEGWIDMIRRCWEYIPHSRPDIGNVCDFFDGELTKLRGL
ncbi:hypothetical protein KUTeg_025009 [Tegillarca granosa]|uniref:Protein kinase domain-containing protein n=1 Tax=Tegillarca granosa TaxID=220873 RepID=A0ABQ9DYY3_TEGGR|nr:hypothetical protein KUTeg_025009 [Tegillarca granosa]